MPPIRLGLAGFAVCALVGCTAFPAAKAPPQATSSPASEPSLRLAATINQAIPDPAVDTPPNAPGAPLTDLVAIVAPPSPAGPPPADTRAANTPPEAASPDPGAPPDALGPLSLHSAAVPEHFRSLFENLGDVEAERSNLWDRVRDGFALKSYTNSHVERHTRWFAEHPAHLDAAVERARRYLYFVVDEIEARHLPTELALLPFVESEYDPTLTSGSQAAGLWQIVPITAKHLGLDRNAWYDGRRDVLASTLAALDYLEFLHGQFKDWKLVLAAYNSGDGAVGALIAQARKRGRPATFEKLPLPVESRALVHKVMALKEIVESPAETGVALPFIPNQPYFSRVTARQTLDLREAARLAEVPMAELKALNPGYRRLVIKPRANQRHLLLPADKVEVFHDNLALAAIEDDARGVTPESTGGSGTASSRAADDPPADAPKKPAAARTRVRTHTVVRGDTLGGIARRHGVRLSELKRWNGLRSTLLRPGQVLSLQKAAPKRVYTVRRGDNLHDIARRFEVSIPELRRWNRLKHHSLMPGDRIAIRP